MKYILAVLVMVAIWAPTVILAYYANKNQRYLNETPGFINMPNDTAIFAWVVGVASLLTTIFLTISSIQNNWL